MYVSTYANKYSPNYYDKLNELHYSTINEKNVIVMPDISSKVQLCYNLVFSSVYLLSI